MFTYRIGERPATETDTASNTTATQTSTQTATQTSDGRCIMWVSDIVASVDESGRQDDVVFTTFVAFENPPASVEGAEVHGEVEIRPDQPGMAPQTESVSGVTDGQGVADVRVPAMYNGQYHFTLNFLYWPGVCVHDSGENDETNTADWQFTGG